MKQRKKTKNGFTLIELLAVIIILGILMIIAIPSVTSYINNSRKSAYVDTAKEIVAGARNFVNEGRVPMYDTSATYYIKASCISTENGQKSPYGDFVDEETYVVVTYDGKGYDYYWVSRDEAGLGVPIATPLKDLDEETIKSDIEVGTIIPIKISDDKSNVQVINSTCNGFEAASESGNGGDTPSPISYEGKERDELVVGDPVKIGNEEFNVVSNDGTNLVLLAHYNLKVGKIYNSGGTKTGEYTSDDDGYGLQSSDAKGWVSGANRNGTVVFSSTNYWSSSTSSYPTDVYDKDNTNCTIATYVEAYKDYLNNNLKAPIKEARLLTYNEATALGCSPYACSGAPAFVKETSYWLESALGPGSLWSINSGGAFGSSTYSVYNYSGVRPVIVI